MSKIEKMALACILCIMLVGCGSFWNGLTGQMDAAKIKQHTELVTHIDTLRTNFDTERSALKATFDAMVENKDLESALAVGQQIDQLAKKYNTEIGAIASTAEEIRATIEDDAADWKFKAGSIFGTITSVILGFVLKGRGRALQQVIQGVELLGLTGGKDGQKSILAGIQDNTTMALVNKIRNNIITEKKG